MRGAKANSCRPAIAVTSSSHATAARARAASAAAAEKVKTDRDKVLADLAAGRLSVDEAEDLLRT